MVSNLITAQVIRYVTDRVMENLTRQAGRALPGGDTPTSNVAGLAVVAQFNQQIERLGGRIDELDARIGDLNARLASSEKRSGWRYTLRLTFGIIVGVGVGVGATLLARFVGWVG